MSQEDKIVLGNFWVQAHGDGVSLYKGGRVA